MITGLPSTIRLIVAPKLTIRAGIFNEKKKREREERLGFLWVTLQVDTLTMILIKSSNAK